jgi:hypothetical protein
MRVFLALVGETDSYSSSKRFRYTLYIDAQQFHAHVVVNLRVRALCIAWTEWTDARQGDYLFYILFDVWRRTAVSTGTPLLPVQTGTRIC